MALDTAATHAYWLVVLLAAGGAFGTVLLREVDETRAAVDERRDLELAALRADVGVVLASLDHPASRVRLEVRNAGDLPLDPLRASVLFDGTGRTVEAVAAGGVGGGRVWMPGTHANITVVSTWAPHRVALADPYGHVRVWDNPEPPYPVVIDVTPDPAQVEFLASRQFAGARLDQYGDPYDGSALTWSTDVTGAAIDANGLFAAGTEVDCGYVTASDGSLSGSADVCTYREAPVVTSVVVSPSSASVEFLRTRQFTAQAYDQYGLPTSATFSWATDVAGSTVSSTGLFTAGTTAGSGVVRATTSGVVGTAAVSVYRNPAVVTSIAVTPSPATVQATKTQQFTAQAYDQYGLAMSATFTWSTTVAGGTVSGSGLFTAGTTLASGSVTATSGGVGGSASATVSPLEVRVSDIRMYKGTTETYTFRRNEKARVEATILAVLDGTAVSDVTVAVDWRNPSGTSVQTATDATSASGVADDTYHMPNAPPTGSWTVRVTGVTATWISYRSDLNAETIQVFTVQ